MNRLLFFLSFLIFFSSGSRSFAQEIPVPIEEWKEPVCDIFPHSQKLRKKNFISTSPFLLRVDNQEYLYAEAQLGKRKHKIFLFLKVLTDNVCLKKEKNVDIYFSSGEILRLKNDYPLNCEGVWVREFSAKELEKIKNYPIEFIRLYTYDKDYEFYLSNEQNKILKRQIDCLKTAKKPHH